MHRTASAAARSSSSPPLAYDLIVSVPLSKQFRWPFGVDEDDAVEFWEKDHVSAPIFDIPLARVSATQWDLDQRKVDRIKESWSDSMPPPIVAAVPHHDGRLRFPIGDGHHRIAAAIQLGKTTIKAQVV